MGNFYRLPRHPHRHRRRGIDYCLGALTSFGSTNQLMLSQRNLSIATKGDIHCLLGNTRCLNLHCFTDYMHIKMPLNLRATFRRLHLISNHPHLMIPYTPLTSKLYTTRMVMNGSRVVIKQIPDCWQMTKTLLSVRLSEGEDARSQPQGQRELGGVRYRGFGAP